MAIIETLHKNRKPIIITSSLFASVYFIYSLYYRLSLAFSDNQDLFSELKSILFDLPILIPAILGLFYYYKIKLLNSSVVFSYSIFLLVTIFIIVLMLTQNDALAFGLPMLLIVLPICLVISIILIFDLFKRKQH